MAARSADVLLVRYIIKIIPFGRAYRVKVDFLFILGVSRRGRGGGGGCWKAILKCNSIFAGSIDLLSSDLQLPGWISVSPLFPPYSGGGEEIRTTNESLIIHSSRPFQWYPTWPRTKKSTFGGAGREGEGVGELIPKYVFSKPKTHLNLINDSKKNWWKKNFHP